MAASHDGRYAPSPTGDLHVGNLRTALVAWLAARSVEARFLLRIDDLDPDRSRPEYELRQIEDLRALGIDWDGEPVRQSTRLDRYHEAIDELVRRDFAYPCFCSRADVLAAAGAPHGSVDGAYPGTCAHLGVIERGRRVAAGEPHSLRVRADAASGSFEDRFLGTVSARVDDFVVRRRDGVPAYNLATVLDEADLGIGEVVRGADLAETTVRHLWLAGLLEVDAPSSFAHVSLVLGPDEARLAKRHGAVTLRELAAGGADAGLVLRQLAGSIGIDRAGTRTASDLLPNFALDRVPHGPVHLDGLTGFDRSDP